MARRVRGPQVRAARRLGDGRVKCASCSARSSVTVKDGVSALGPQIGS